MAQKADLVTHGAVTDDQDPFDVIDLHCVLLW
jgi:hypothetical protein